jgi:soluble lytic murein transglycosylase
VVKAAPAPKAAAKSTAKTVAKPAAKAAEKQSKPASRPVVSGSSESSALLFAKRKDWGEAAAHAKRTGSAALQKLVEWMRLRDGDVVAQFDEYDAFLSQPNAWPDSNTLLARAQEALLINGGAESTMRRWYEAAKAINGTAIPASYLHAEFVRQAYIDGDYTSFEENLIRNRYASIIRQSDTLARANRLVWEDKFSGAERILQYLTRNDKTMLEARIALLRNQPKAEILYSGLSSMQKKDPAVIYAAMRNAMRNKEDAKAEKFLLQAPENIPYANHWWRTRASLVRDAIEAGNYRHAQKLLDNKGHMSGEALSDALFMEGWLLLEFRDKPQEAYKKFYELFNAVKFPVSKSRAAYWAGLAAEKNGNKEIAKGWFVQGAAYPSQFYGQLSSLKAYGTAPLKFPALPQASAVDKAAVNKRGATEAMRILMRQKEVMMADRFLGHLIDTADNEAQIVYLSSLVADGGSNYLGVKSAKRALRSNVVLLERGWPRMKISFTPPIEAPLMYAITRQESEFRSDARSHADAIGMMQLLPKTASYTAKRNNIPYKGESQLVQPSLNMQLGTHYLGGLISQYDGNYILAIAAYNAGPKNVNSWLGRFGTPGKSLEQSLRWIEQIPFGETRNYVQRVLENAQVYRHRMADGKTPKLRISEDLVHKTHLTELPEQ